MKKIEKERKENKQRNLDNLESIDNKFFLLIKIKIKVRIDKRSNYIKVLYICL